MNSAKPLDLVSNSKHVSKEIEIFKQSILGKKNAYNKIRHEAVVKSEILTNLLEKLGGINEMSKLGKETTILKAKNFEHSEVDIGVKNEEVNQETLFYMLNRLKSESVKKKPEISKIRKKIEKVDQQRAIIEKKMYLAIGSLSELEKQYEAEEGLYSKILAEKNEKVTEKTAIYQEKYKLKLCIDQERELNLVRLKQKNDIQKLRFLESKLGNFKDMELLNQEIFTFENYCTQAEEKFKAIQKVTHVNNIGDILVHYKFLTENKQRLFKSISLASEQIERLSGERKELSNDLSELKYQNSEHKGLNENDLENIQEKFREKEKHIEIYEVRLENLQTIIALAVNTFARVGKMLGIKNSGIRTENLLQNMEACAEQLANIIQEIQEEDSAHSESIDLSISAVSSKKNSIL